MNKNWFPKIGEKVRVKEGYSETWYNEENLEEFLFYDPRLQFPFVTWSERNKDIMKRLEIAPANRAKMSFNRSELDELKTEAEDVEIKLYDVVKKDGYIEEYVLFEFLQNPSRSARIYSPSTGDFSIYSLKHLQKVCHKIALAPAIIRKFIAEQPVSPENAEGMTRAKSEELFSSFSQAEGWYYYWKPGLGKFLSWPSAPVDFVIFDKE